MSKESRDMLNREKLNIEKRLQEIYTTLGQLDERDGRSLKLSALNFEKDTENKCINVTINMTPEVSQSGQLLISLDEIEKVYKFVEAAWIYLIRRPKEIAAKKAKEAAKNQK